MGQCYAKNIPVAEDDRNHEAPPTPAANGGDVSVSGGSAAHPAPKGGTIPSRSSAGSPWLSPFRHSSYSSPFPAGVSPSPARSTPRRFLRRPFPPPSPAKHIKASLAKRQGAPKHPEGAIPEDGGAGAGGGLDPQAEQLLDKSFGYGTNFGAKYELGKEVGRGHFGHTCSARAKKGDIKGQLVAVKIISKAKLEPLAYRKMDFEEFCAATISPYQLEALENWEHIASAAFEYFEQEGNRVIFVEELAQEMNLAPAAYSIVLDWIRPSDGKLSFLGYTKFLHGVTIRTYNTRHHR
ncbi:putative CDPK-related protein kinase [Cocos nucifera]|uniref:Putative CDPK-related protein kinase n=1 Tax=Cocos nucifera TaxID=13894 RepID=A0A8K0N852_COCNU|nr:putative CDPK-related protein kinase [Cocos nucifera]